MSAVDLGANLNIIDAPFQGIAKKREAGWIANNIALLGDIAPPAGRARRVIFTAFSRFGFSGKGKVYTEDYFPAFTHHLARQGVDCHFVWTEDQLADCAALGNYAIVHLFNEEKYIIYTPQIRAAEEGAQAVFCTHRAASIIADKRRANQLLTAQGISMPKLVNSGDDAPSGVFSNAEIGSGKRVIVTAGSEDLAVDRYNTQFIDTQINFGGKTWYTMFRIQAVGGYIHHAYVRARDAAERAPSVHSKDTPANAALIEHLYDNLIAPRRAEIALHTKKMGEILGPGFYAHDMVVCQSTGRMYMVETGFKFNDSPYAAYLQSAQDETPSNRIFYDSTYPIAGAHLFLKVWDQARNQPPPAPWRIYAP